MNSLQSNDFHFQVKFSAKLKPEEKVTFHLRYEELLQRSEQGKYSYVVNIQPQKRKIKDFRLNVDIDESLPIKEISVLRAKDKDAAKFQAEDITKQSLTSSGKSAQIQTNATNNKQDWKFFINYDVKRPQDGNDVQISGGRFVHYFAPDNIPSIAKVTYIRLAIISCPLVELRIICLLPFSGLWFHRRNSNV